MLWPFCAETLASRPLPACGPRASSWAESHALHSAPVACSWAGPGAPLSTGMFLMGAKPAQAKTSEKQSRLLGHSSPWNCTASRSLGRPAGQCAWGQGVCAGCLR